MAGGSGWAEVWRRLVECNTEATCFGGKGVMMRGAVSPLPFSSSEMLESPPFTCWLFVYSMFHPLIVCESHLYAGAPSMHDLCLMPCGSPHVYNVYFLPLRLLIAHIFFFCPFYWIAVFPWLTALCECQKVSSDDIM